MKLKESLANFFAVICLTVVAAMAHASEAVFEPELPTVASSYFNKHNFSNYRPYLLAQNEVPTAKSQDEISVTSFEKFNPPLFTGSNAHKFLGVGTLALVIATAVAPKPPEVEDRAPTQAELDAQKSSSHAKLGRAAATLAVATVATGLLYHWDDFHLEDGLFDPDNQHALLGAAGALAMLYAISKAPDEGHAGMGIAGGAAMAVAIKLTW